MLNKIISGLLFLSLSFFSMLSFATEKNHESMQFDVSSLYLGASLGGSSLDGLSDAITLDGFSYQFFAGYKLPFKIADKVNIAVETGLYDSGDMDFGPANTTKASGIWVDGVVSGSIKGKLGWLGRIGFDFGDDDGLMYGGGVSYQVTPMISTQLEFIFRDNIDTMLISASIPFGSLSK